MNKTRGQFVLFLLFGFLCVKPINAAETAPPELPRQGHYERAESQASDKDAFPPPTLEKRPDGSRITIYHDVESDGITTIVRQSPDNTVCGVQVVIDESKFLNHINEYVDVRSILPRNPQSEYKYHIYLEYLEFSQWFSPQITNIIMDKPGMPNFCTFQFGYRQQNERSHGIFNIILEYQFTKSLYNKLDWNRVNQSLFPTVAINYYISPDFSYRITRQEAGFKDSL